MRPPLALLLCLLALAAGGCVSPTPDAKPAVPVGVVAPDPKPANAAQAEADIAGTNPFTAGNATVVVKSPTVRWLST